MKETKIKLLKFKNNWKIISLFIAFTFSIWLVLQLSKNYIYNFPVLIQIVDLPVEIEIEDATIDIAFNLTGFQLLSKLKSNSVIEIEASSTVIKDSAIVLPEKQIIEKTKESLGLPINSIVNLETKKLPLIRREKKTISLRFEQQIRFSNQYNSLEGVTFEANQIEVTAPSFILDTLKSLKVEPLVLTELDQKKEGSLKILNPNASLINLSQTEVAYEIDVHEFTEKKLILPFQVIGLPDNYTLITFPENVQLQFQVPLADYSSVNAEDFEVIVDFNQRLEDQILLIPKLKTYPKDILNPTIYPKTIDYLIKYIDE